MSQTCRRDCGSRPVVGSSRNRSSGSPTSAQATARRCFWPPESVPTRAVGLLRELDLGDHRVRRAAARGRSCGRGRTVSSHLQLLREDGLLQADADALADRLVVAAPAPAQDHAPRPRSARAALPGSRSWSSCPRRSGRGGRSTRRARPRRRGRAPPRPFRRSCGDRARRRTARCPTCGAKARGKGPSVSIRSYPAGARRPPLAPAPTMCACSRDGRDGRERPTASAPSSRRGDGREPLSSI